MNKKHKSSIILASLASIAVAGSVIAGSTYALFTSEAKTNIAVTSGTVSVTAEVDEGSLITYSGKDLTGNVTTDVVKPTTELGYTNGTFANGGTAKIEENGSLSLTNMTPGDKVTFTIKVTNESNVKVKYCTVISTSEDNDLFEALEVKIDGTTYDGTEIATPYLNLLPGEDPTDIAVSIYLPVDKGDDYQGKNCTIVSTVRAVQGNAHVGESVSSKADLQTALEDGEDASLTENLTLDNGEYFSITQDTVIYGNGKTFYANNEKVSGTVKGRVIDVDSVDDITITLVDLNIVGPTCNEYNRGISIWGCKNVKVVLDNCTVSANHYALNIADDNDNIEIVAKNTTFVGYAAFQTYSKNTKATFDNCTLKGVNQWNIGGADGTQNDFATINVVSSATSNELVFKGCTIEAVQQGTALERFISTALSDLSIKFANCTFKHNGTEIAFNNDNLAALTFNTNYYNGPDCNIVFE